MTLQALRAYGPTAVSAPLRSSVRVSSSQPQAVLAPSDTLKLSSTTASQPSILKDLSLPPHVPGELLIRLKPGMRAQSLNSLNQDLGLQLLRTISFPGLNRSGDAFYRVQVAHGQSLHSTLQALQKRPEVLYAEPNFIVKADQAQVVPNDLDPRQWSLRNQGQNGGKPSADIKAPQAWSITQGQGADGPILGVLDTGIDYTHPDLQDNIWINKGEIEGDGIDNDQNGYVDDVRGWDFVNNDNDPQDDHGHGTHVAGTIAAKGNNGQGITGVTWNSRLMPLKFMDANGYGTTENAIRALFYAISNGALITNNSWGGEGFSQALKDAISSTGLFVASAGNSTANNDVGEHYPSGYQLSNIISVGATDAKDEKAPFSNYGRRNVDLMAPGVDIYSTLPGGKYGMMSGTSMSAPHVTGVAGLIRSQYGHLSEKEVKTRILNSVDRLDSLGDNTLTSGRLNAFRSLENDTVHPAPLRDVRLQHPSFNSLQLQWRATGDDGLKGQAVRYDIRYSEHPLTNDTFAQAKSVSQRLHPAVAGQLENFTLTDLYTRPEGQMVYVGIRAIDNVGNASPIAFVNARIPASHTRFDDNVEGGNVWQIEGSWAPVKQPNGNTVWEDSPGQNLPNTQSSLTSPLISLKGARQATLFFDQRHNLEYTFDYGYLDISSDQGKTWSNLHRYTGLVDWQRTSVDLHDYAGQQVQLRFRVETDESETWDGWELDNIRVVTDKP